MTIELTTTQHSWCQPSVLGVSAGASMGASGEAGGGVVGLVVRSGSD